MHRVGEALGNSDAAGWGGGDTLVAHRSHSPAAGTPLPSPEKLHLGTEIFLVPPAHIYRSFLIIIRSRHFTLYSKLCCRFTWYEYRMVIPYQQFNGNDSLLYLE